MAGRRLSERECPIWGGVNAKTQAMAQADEYLSDSERMDGQFGITRSAFINQANLDEAYKVKLTSWVIDQRRLGVEVPVISDTVLEAVHLQRPLSVAKRLDRFLAFCVSRQNRLGERFNYFVHEALLAWTESVSDDEVWSLAIFAAQKNWIELDRHPAHSTLMISAEGYAYLDELQSNRVNSNQAFVAMWFDASLNDAYAAGIKPGIEDAGYTAVRVDAVDHNNKIDDTIIAEIRRSRFLVADFTHGEKGHRGGVYYEAGFAHGLNIPVIFTCREDIIGEIHFDTRQYNHITWKEPAELREKLSKRISATIGDGPNRKAP